ncbi:MAG: hypothetical protein DMD72_11210 [Gemmatimonadetes bacterium]|nr:MAG: hypothetical protein DMD72_11210 [Gemmatimonadota bacterium]
MTVSPPLRIAMMLESDGPGGAEMMVFRLSEELRRRGHVIVPVGPKHGIGWLGDRFRGAGFPTEVFRLRRAIDPLCVLELERMFREQSVDAVHSHEFTMAVYGAAAAGRLGLPHVITMHGGFRATKALRRRIALRWAVRKSNHVVMVSKATRKSFASELGLDESVFRTIPNGVTPEQGDPDRVRAEFEVDESDCVLLAVGTLERHKGHRVLLEALALLANRRLNVPWKLVIAGGRGGDQYEPLIRYVREAGLDKRVRIVTNRSDIPDLLAMADVFVMPSIIEGLPLALLEAMLAGKAIVASATAGIPEAIVHGRDGLLVPPEDANALAGALHLLLTNPTRRSALAAAAVVRAQAEFTVKTMADRYETLYKEACTARLRGVAGRWQESHAVTAC